MRRFLRSLAAATGAAARIPRPTRAGLCFLGLSAGVAVLAVATASSGVLLLLGSLVFVLLASVWLPVLNLRRIEVERILPPSVHAHERFLAAVRLRLDGRRSPAYGILVTDGPAGPYAEPGRALAVKIARDEPVLLRFSVRVKDRGPHVVAGLRLSTSFPFGLFEHSVSRTLETEILVFPRIGSFREEPLPGSRFARRMTSTETVRERGQEEFRNIREYRAGDNPRLIAWKASARHGELMVKELEDDLTKRVTLFLESRLEAGARRADRLRLERTISFAASLLRRLARRRYSVHLFLFGPRPEDVATGKGGRHLDRVMERLARLQPSPDGSVAELVARAPERSLVTSLPVLVLPVLSEARLRAALSRLSPRRPAVCFHMDGDWEKSVFGYHDDPFDAIA